LGSVKNGNEMQIAHMELQQNMQDGFGDTWKKSIYALTQNRAHFVSMWLKIATAQ
jgi:hypothetical protein